MQSKLESFIEGLTDTAIGFLIAFISQMVIFPLHGLNVPLQTNLSITLCFTVISLVRRYIVRRAFNDRTITQRNT